MASIAAVLTLASRGTAVAAAGGLVVDLHCHAVGIGEGGSGCFVSEKLEGSFRYGVYMRAFSVTRRELGEHGDGLIIRRISEKLAASSRVAAAVVLALDGVVDERGDLDRDRTELYVPNDFVHRETARHANLLYGPSVNPLRRNAIALLEREAARGAVLVKWLPNIQLFDPADPRIDGFYRKLKDLRLPLLTHGGRERAFSVSRDEYGDPMRLKRALDLGVTVIVAHAASLGRSEGERNMDRLLKLARAYPNLYVDISAMTQVNRRGHLRRLLRHRDIMDRLVYGTDMPLLETALVSPWYSLFTVGPGGVRRLLGEENPWDRDVLYKKELGVPEEVFHRAAGLLRVTRLPAVREAPSACAAGSRTRRGRSRSGAWA